MNTFGKPTDKLVIFLIVAILNFYRFLKKIWASLMVWEWYDTVKNFILSILMWPPTDLDEKQYRHTCLGGHPMTVCSILSFLLSSFIVSPLKHILLFWIIYKIPMFPNSLIYISFKLNNYLWTTDHSSRHPLLQMCYINDSIIGIVPSMFVWIC